MQAGIELMVVGMGTVFGFLVLLVLMMSTMGSLVPRWFPEEPEPEVQSGADSSLNRKQKMAVAAAVAWSQRSGS